MYSPAKSLAGGCLLRNNQKKSAGVEIRFRLRAVKATGRREDHFQILQGVLGPWNRRSGQTATRFRRCYTKIRPLEYFKLKASEPQKAQEASEEGHKVSWERRPPVPRGRSILITEDGGAPRDLARCPLYFP